MFKQDTIGRLVRFALVGGTVAVVHSALIWYFYSVVGWGARVSFWAGYFPGVALHFCLTKWWTFRCARPDLVRQVVRYALVAVVTASVQFGIYHVVLLWVTANPNLAYAITAILGMGLSFALLQGKVFRGAVETPPP